MQSYIRPLGEGSFDLRALMKYALPLLITKVGPPTQPRPHKGPCLRAGFGEAGLTYRVINSIIPRIVRQDMSLGTSTRLTHCQVFYLLNLLTQNHVATLKLSATLSACL
jgi:hypothetical protein